MRRHETRSTMMTSNRPLEDWGKLIGDVPAATGVPDRFLHRAEILTIEGRSYRLKNPAGGQEKKEEEVVQSKREGGGSRRSSRSRPKSVASEPQTGGEGTCPKDGE